MWHRRPNCANVPTLIERAESGKQTTSLTKVRDWGQLTKGKKQQKAAHYVLLKFPYLLYLVDTIIRL